MTFRPKNKKANIDSDHQVIRQEVVEKGKRLAKDPNYPDKKIIRKIAEKLATDALID